MAEVRSGSIEPGLTMHYTDECKEMLRWDLTKLGFFPERKCLSVKT